MAGEVFIQGGNAYLRHPDSGAVIPVPEAELADAIDAGMVPADPQEFATARRREHYGAGGKAWLAGLAGAGRGATLGLSDVLMTQTGMVAPETLAGLREANPQASTMGDVAGSVASFFIPGSPLAGLTRAGVGVGKAATGGVARMLAQSSARALPRLAGSLTREGLIGAGIGAGAGISEAALAPESLSPGELAARVLGEAGKGAAFGAGLGTLTWLSKTAALRAKQSYTLGLEEIKALRGERGALRAELEAATASGAAAESTARLEAQLAGVSSQLHEAQMGAVGKVFSRAAAYGLGHAIGGGVVGGLVGVIVGPKVLKTALASLKPLGEKAAGALVDAGEKVEPYLSAAWEKVAGTAEAAWSKVAPHVERMSETPLGQAVVEQAKQEARGFSAQVAQRYPIAQRLVAAAGGKVAHIPDLVVSGAMVGGLPGAAVGYVAHRFQQPIGQAVEGLMAKVAPAARIGVLESLTRGDWHSAAEELRQVPPEGVDLAVRMMLPENSPPEIQAAVSARLRAALGAVQQAAGPAMPDERIPTGDEPPKGPASDKAKRVLKAIADPGSMLVAFAQDELTPEQVAAWEAVYPEALAQVRAIVSAKVVATTARGGHYRREKADQIALLLGKPAAGSRLSQPATMARMQAMHRAARQPRQQRPGGQPLGLATQHQTPMQRLARGGVR